MSTGIVRLGFPLFALQTAELTSSSPAQRAWDQEDLSRTQCCQACRHHAHESRRHHRQRACLSPLRRQVSLLPPLLLVADNLPTADGQDSVILLINNLGGLPELELGVIVKEASAWLAAKDILVERCVSILGSIFTSTESLRSTASSLAPSSPPSTSPASRSRPSSSPGPPSLPPPFHPSSRTTRTSFLNPSMLLPTLLAGSGTTGDAPKRISRRRRSKSRSLIPRRSKALRVSRFALLGSDGS